VPATSHGLHSGADYPVDVAGALSSDNPLIRGLRSSKWARRGLSALSAALILGAIGLLGYPLFTNLYQDYRQGQLGQQLVSPRILQAYRAGAVPVGDSLTRLKIPALGVDVVVVEGTTTSALRAGAGHYAGTPLPCDPGNVAIAGHRTTYGKPFNQIDRLKPGDAIILETPIGTCTYQVAKAPFVVLPSDVTVVDAPPAAATPARWLTLTSCTPKGSASHRIIVRAVYSSGTVTVA
jgi:sortase A